MGRPTPHARNAAICQAVANGAQLSELAAQHGITPQSIRLVLKKAGQKIQRRPKPAGERELKMATMYRQGVTLAKIGAQFKLTRERVRQILAKQGVTASEGGAAKTSAVNKADASAKREGRYMAQFGFPYAVVAQLRADGVLRAYAQHKRNSAARAIDFKLTFSQWFSVWQASGKIDQRGRGQGKYVMSRIRDDGCYELGNVHIQSAVENSREATQKWIGQPKKENQGVFLLYPGTGKPWMAKVSRKSLGRFASEAEAVEAREAFFDANPEQVRKGKGYAHIRAGRGRERYQVMVGPAYVGTFYSPEEALAAREAFLATEKA